MVSKVKIENQEPLLFSDVPNNGDGGSWWIGETEEQIGPGKEFGHTGKKSNNVKGQSLMFI